MGNQISVALLKTLLGSWITARRVQATSRHCISVNIVGRTRYSIIPLVMSYGMLLQLFLDMSSLPLIPLPCWACARLHLVKFTEFILLITHIMLCDIVTPSTFLCFWPL